MPKVKVSVVIPVYNVDRYLRQCIDSVIRQSLEDIEIIVINDASTDSSGAILQAYAEADDRVRVFNAEVNRGVSAARNIGIEKAVGDYVVFIDADDFWVNSEVLRDLYDRCVKENLDILEFGIHRSGNEFDELPSSSGRSQFVLMRPQVVWAVRYNICAKLISRKLLLTNQLRFNTELIIGEDALFSIYLYCYAERLAIYDRIYYFYRTHSLNVTSLGWDSDKLFCTVRWFELAIDAVNDRLSLDQRQHVLQAVANERLEKLLHRLGPVALEILDEQALANYVERWQRCLAAMDYKHVGQKVVEQKVVEQDLRLGDDARLLALMLDAVRRNDVAEFRAFFESDAYQQDKMHSPGAVTLKHEEALMVAQSILLASGENIRCDFGGGVFVTLPRTKAHQLAAQLQANRQPTITFQFEL